MSEKAFLIDSTKCIGCRTCQIACKQFNELPAASIGTYNIFSEEPLSAISWNIVKFDKIKLKKKGLSKQIVWDMFPVRCNHCRDAVCYNVCPEKAIYKEDGWTKINPDKCIGCGTCEKSCPFNAVHVLKKKYPGLEKDKAYKCHGCIDAKDTPACVSCCPSEALIYDYRLKLIKYAKNRLKEIKTIFPEATLFGFYKQKGLNVFTLVKDKNVVKKLAKKNIKISNKQISKMSEIRDVYKLLKNFSFGSNSVKRFMHSLAKIIAG